MKRNIIIISFCFFSATLFGQLNDSSHRKIKYEAFFNISSALGKATGNTSSTTFISDPILMGVKITKENGTRAIRTGLNFYISSSDALSQASQRVNTEEFYSFNLGIEKRKSLGHRLAYYYGFDIKYYSEKSKTTINFNTGNKIYSTVQNGPGFSPLIGFQWDITPRFSLFTEGSIGLEVINKYRYIRAQNGTKDVLEDKIDFTARPVAPGAIFLTFRL